MRKLYLLPLLLLLAACGAATGSQEATTVQEGMDAADDVTQEAPDTSEAIQLGKMPVATGTTPEEASIIREQDHIKGASDPLVTVIEYGDFQ